VRSGKYSLSTEQMLLAIGAFALTATGCKSNPALFQASIIEGAEFAHSVNLPDPFYYEKDGRKKLIPRLGEKQVFKISASNELLIKARSIATDEYSENAFVILKHDGYGTRPATSAEWSSAVPSDELLNPRRPKIVASGFDFKGRIYPVRGDWTDRRGLEASEDEALVMVIAAVRPDAAKNGGYLIDIFDGKTGRRLAGLDLSHSRGDDFLGLRRVHIHLINSRWFAVTMDEHLQRILLFDFQPRHGSGVTR
jgi:hypothetical protein